MFDLILFFNIIAGMVVLGKTVLIIRYLPRIAFDFLAHPNSIESKRRLRLTFNGKPRDKKRVKY